MTLALSRFSNGLIKVQSVYNVVQFFSKHYFQCKTNEWGLSKINFFVGPQEPLLEIVTRWKLAWFGHVTPHDSLTRTILKGTLEGG